MRSRQPVAVTAGRALGHGLATRRRQVVAGLVLGLLLSPIGIAAVGGFETADEVEPVSIATGESVDLGQVEVTVESFFVSDVVYPSGLPDGGTAWLGLMVDVVNRGDEDVVMNDDLFRVPQAVPLREDPTFEFIVSDDSILTILGPDVPQQVAVLWPLADPNSVGDELDVEAYPVPQRDSFLFPGDAYWEQQPLLGRLVVPRGDVPPSLIDEDA